jgi:Na+-translocating ferredoxin:NAD+ oxidoreductase subunit G
MNRTLVFQATSLAVLSGVATFGLAWSASSTRDRVEAAMQRDFEALLEQVIPPESHDNALRADTSQRATARGPVDFTLARRDGQVVAVAFQTSSIGYSGPIGLLLAVTPDGVLIGVRVTSHTETPGLGDRIEVSKGDWILKFDGLSLTNPGPEHWRVKKDGGDFDALTGATITPRAVVKGVKEGLELFDQQRSALLSSPPAQPLANGEGANVEPAATPAH